MESFHEFEKNYTSVMFEMKDEKLFINTKKEIEEEIVFIKKKLISC